jgi:hypothetical protein
MMCTSLLDVALALGILAIVMVVFVYLERK